MMYTADHLIHAKWIITNSHSSPLENHSLVLKNGLICDILPTSLAQQHHHALHTHTYSTHAIMPGLINAHTHIGMNYFRGLADDLPLMEWLHQHMFPAEATWLSHEFVRDASLMAMAEMIRSGTTCFNDMFYFLQATAEAAEISGLRAHIGLSVLEFPTNWAQNADEYFTKGIEFYEQYCHHPLITTTLAPHAPYTVSDASFCRIRQLADQYHLKINLHLHETQDEINQSLKQFHKRPIQRLHDLNFLNDDVLAIHMTQLNEQDFDILAQTKPHVIHCPESNMKLASGICPVSQLKKLGINVALGTDSVASNNDLDMISEMRSANLMAKVHTLNPQSLNAFETMAMATQNGAKALGIDKTVGTLEQGKAADLIVIDLNTIETLPTYHPLSQIVYSSNRQQVSDVWVAGKHLMHQRQLLTLDEEMLKEKAIFWGKKIGRN